MTTIQFACCFCGESGADIGVAFTNMETGEFEQQWWCHTACFLERLVPEARLAYVDMSRPVGTSAPEGADAAGEAGQSGS